MPSAVMPTSSSRASTPIARAREKPSSVFSANSPRAPRWPWISTGRVMTNAHLRTATALLLLAGLSQAQAQNARADRQATIATLLDTLKSAPSEDAAGPIEMHISHLWLEEASP